MTPQTDLKRQKREVLVPRIEILGVGVDDISGKEALTKLMGLAKDTHSTHFAATVNPEFVMLARKDLEFAKILRNADLCLADGVGVVISKLILGGRAKDRITGVDLVEKLCSMSEENAIRVGFLGGFGDVAETVQRRQKAKFPKMPLALAMSGDPAIEADLASRKAISAAGRIDVLFVAYGMGKQEYWIQRNLNKLDVGVAIGVGGALDYLSAVKRRAPAWMQKSGLEWLWRLVQEPQRAVRMRVLPVFLVLVLFQWLKRVFHAS